MNVSMFTTQVRSELDVLITRQRARDIARLLGFDMQAQTRIATAVSEIARNCIQHATCGRVEFKLGGGSPQLLEIHINDDGAGITDLEGMLRPRKSTAPEIGDTLRGVRRLLDVFHIETKPTGGISVTMGTYRNRHLPDIDRRDVLRITDELVQHRPEDPLAAIHSQNQELLCTLDELRTQQEERAEHLQQIEVLNMRLRRAILETHHRVKNNLQLIAALIDLQRCTDRETVPMEEFTRLGQSVTALGVIHDLLTQEARSIHEDEGDKMVSATAVMTTLLPMLEQTTGAQHVHFTLDEARLSGHKLTALSLITNELVSNAVKHGKGAVDVCLRVADGMAVMEVSDDGPGFAEGFDPIQDSNTGLELIENVAKCDLSATIFYTTRPGGGGHVTVSFPL